MVRQLHGTPDRFRRWNPDARAGTIPEEMMPLKIPPSPGFPSGDPRGIQRGRPLAITEFRP
jgi:hypothetical protein